MTKDYVIKLQVCGNCQTVHYPRRDICSACWQDALETQPVSAKGQVCSFTDLHISAKPKWADKLPVRVGLIKLDVGPNVLAFMEAKISSNTPVVLVDENGVFTAKESI